MERPILLNMKPREVEELFAMGQLAIIKKNRPSNYFLGFTCLMYQAKSSWAYEELRSMGIDGLAERLLSSRGMVVGKCVCYKTNEIQVSEDGSISDDTLKEMDAASLRKDEAISSIGRGNTGYAWCLSNAKLFNWPRKVEIFSAPTFSKSKVMMTNNAAPPRNWRYACLPSNQL